MLLCVCLHYVLYLAFCKACPLYIVQMCMCTLHMAIGALHWYCRGSLLHYYVNVKGSLNKFMLHKCHTIQDVLTRGSRQLKMLREIA